jgi:O-antigen ligase|tara:strand:- start:495 stop:1676 length:1182 start_codon:yes stop_codon:yes gene_type:complete
MVKFKDNVIKLQFISLLIIPIVPHLDFFLFLHLDDIPVILFIFLSIFQIFFSDQKFKLFSNTYSILVFVIYITVQNYFINRNIIFSDNLRYTFYLFVLIYVYQFSDKKVIENSLVPLTLSISFFSIFAYVFEFNLGTDLYDYWNIGLNLNEWGFTKGRVNGFQAGGPNALGALIACLTIFSALKVKGNLKYLVIFSGILGCFFTYSRAAFLTLIIFLTIAFLIRKDYKKLLFILLCLFITSSYGLVDRFTSEEETDGVNDRIEMQQTTVNNFRNQNVTNLLIGYGYGNIAIVRDEIKPVSEFSPDLRPTGPHNSYLYIILNYGMVGLLFFILIFSKVTLDFVRNFNDYIQSPKAWFILSFLFLSLTGDFIQNHSISILLFLLYFLLEKEMIEE